MRIWMMEETRLHEYLHARARINISDISGFGGLEELLAPKPVLSWDDTGAPHLAIEGILSPEGPDLIDRIMGENGTSYKDIIEALYEADAELKPGKPIFAHFNTPGGLTRGAEATYAAFEEVSSRRPVVAINEGLLASAGLWLAAGATEIRSAGRSTLTGSVGALQTVVKKDSPEIKVYNFTNPESPNKAPDPATKEGAQVFVDRVQSIYNVFRDDLLKGRKGRATKASVEALKGAVVAAEEAIQAGLIDTIIGFGVKEDNTPAARAGELVGVPDLQGKDREENMILSEYLKAYPSAKVEIDALVSQARSEGDQAARTRQAEVVAKLKPIMEADYPQRVKTVCADAIAGTRSVDEVLDLVAIFDEIKAKDASARAKEEEDTLPETPASPPKAKTEAEELAARDAEWNKLIVDQLS